MKKDNYLTVANYKEPLKKVKKGFGFYGALTSSVDGKYLQCHICGNLYGSLQLHANHAHKLKADEYREKFDLAHSTSLISEEQREIRKKATLEWLSKMTPEQIVEKNKNALEKYGEWKENNKEKIFRHNATLEQKNKRGVCPDQLLEKIKEIKSKVGHTPTLKEFIIETGGQRYSHLIFRTFGSWINALNMLKLKPSKTENKWHRRLSEEELLEYLKLFTEENQTVPTSTDCKRGWIPSFATYKRRFGSLEDARKIAGVYELLGTNKRPSRW